MPGIGFPLELIFNVVEGDVTPLTKTEKKIEKFGMKLRLTGRDLMRIGASIQRFTSGWLSTINNVLKGSLLWEAGLEDISWALEDVGAVLGDFLSPILERIINLIEWFADALERFPALQYITALTIIGLMIGRATASLLNFVGALNLFTGTVLVSNRAVLGFKSSLNIFLKQSWKGKEAIRDYIKELMGLQTATKQSGVQIRFVTEEGQSLTKRLSSLASRFKDAFSAKVQSTLGKVGDKLKKIGGTLWKGVKTLTKWTTTLFTLGFFFMLFPDLADDFEDLIKAISDALSPFGDALSGIIQWLTDWVEENPDIVRALALFLLGLGTLTIFLKIFGFFGEVASKVAGKLGDAVDTVTKPMAQAGASTWKATLANAALVGALALLVFAFTNLFTSLSKMGVGIWEGIAAVTTLFGAILAFLGGLTLLAKALSAIQGQLLTGILAILGLVAAVVLLAWALTELLKPLTELPNGIQTLAELVMIIMLLMTGLTAFTIILGTLSGVAIIGALVMLLMAAAFWVFGAALEKVAGGLTIIVQNLILLASAANTLFPLVPLFFLLGAGIGLLGAMALAATIPITALSFAITTLAFALTMLAGALNLIPEWARGTVGGVVGGVLGKVATAIPHLQEGGIIVEGGLAYLHAGEEVKPAKVVARREERPIVIQFNGPVTDERFVREKIVPILTKELGKR